MTFIAKQSVIIIIVKCSKTIKRTSHNVL